MAISSDSKCVFGDSAVTDLATKKKSYYKQAFNDEWLKDPELKDWIERDPNEKYAVLCKICDTKLVNTNRNALYNHRCSNKHVKNSEAKKNAFSIASRLADSEYDRGDSAVAGPDSKKKSWYKQAFNDEWLKVPELKDWIERDPNDKYAVLCKICDRKLINTNRNALFNHKRSNKHVKNSEAKKNAYSMASRISDSECDCGDLTMAGQASKKLYYNQAFSDEWLNDPELKDWIERDPNEICTVLCKICDTKFINTDRNALFNHKLSNKHVKNSEAKKNIYSMASRISDSECGCGDLTMAGQASKKKLYYNQAFSDEWLNDPELKDWIERDPNEKCTVLCKICDTKLINTNRYALFNHKLSSKHVKNSEAKKNACSMASRLSDSECDYGDSAVSTPASRKKSWYKQAFNDEWLKDPELKDWIKRDPNEKYAVLCKICDRKLINTNKTSLFAHKRTNKHVKNSEAKKHMTTRTSSFKKPSFEELDAGPKDYVGSNSYSEQLLKSLESFCRDNLFCDTVIVTGEQQLKAHSVVLAAASSVFREALESNAEPGMHLLNLSGYDFEVLKAAVRFIYTGKLEVEMKYSSSEKLSELLTSLESLGLCLDQYRSCGMVLSCEAEEFSNESLPVKMEEWIDDNETKSNALRGQDRNSSTTDQLNSSGFRHDNQFHTSSISKERGQSLEDVEAFVAHPSNDFLVPNDVTSGWVLCSETGVRARTLAKVQPRIHKQEGFKKLERVGENGPINTSNNAKCEKCLSRLRNRRTWKTRGNENSVVSQDVATDARSKVLGELPSTHSPAEALHEKLPDHLVKKKRQKLICPTCGKTFVKFSNFTLHLRVHAGEKPYACDICHKMFSSASNLRMHRRSHTGDKRYLCHLCGSAFIQKRNLEDHIAVHTKEKTLLCNLCGKCFKSARSLRAHFMRHKLGSVHSGHENLCQPELSDSVKHAESILMDNGFVRFVCKICKRHYASKSTLAIHIRQHSKTKPFVCSLCKKSFWQRAHLEIHERTHTGERPFTCKTCNKSFTYAGGLSSHVRLHTGEKPYKCDICNSAYAQQSCLKSHLQTHSGEKPYECKACGKKYRNKVDLRFHLKRNDACNKVLQMTIINPSIDKLC